MARMYRMGRRRFVGGAASLSLAAASASALSACSGGTRIENVQGPLIIGSGFGGSVAALRLARAGIRATMLERGRRWDVTPAGDTFCSMREQDERTTWMGERSPIGISTPVRSYAGLIEKVVGDELDAMCPAGVGGGSLIYAGMLLQPPQDLFESVFPASVTYDEMVSTWYPRVLETLPGAPVPDSIIASPSYLSLRIFLDHAERAGLPVERNLSAIDWSLVEAEIRGDIPTEASAGDYIYGLNSGAKVSLDRTYLRQAEATGLLDLRPLHWVERIASDPDGYRVECSHIDEDGIVLERIVFLTRTLILAAGAVGSTRLLVEAKGRGDMPGLPDGIGEGFAQNGQHIVTRAELSEATGEFQGGPPCAVIRHLDNPIAPVTVEYGAAPWGFESHSLICPSSSVIGEPGRIHYDPVDDAAKIEFAASLGRLGEMAGEHTVGLLNTAAGGVTRPLIGRTRPSTFHPLGGVVMDVVADTYGRVNSQPGLYVLDGALIPGSTPCSNPAWTIAAIAERAMDTLIREDFTTR